MSDLSDDEIVCFMKAHFTDHSWFHADPKERIERRRKIESWLHHECVLLGGRPQTEHPCYFTLNESPFLKEYGYYEGTPREIKIPLSVFSSTNVSFTYPDSFFSEWLDRHQSDPLYHRELNGKVFSLGEMLQLLRNVAIPENVYMNTPSGGFQFYIEAQVWDYKLLDSFSI
jgi:hypothetical protein